MSTTDQRRSGRRKGDPDTRGDILAIARTRFARDGFDKTSLRAIAGDAGVDPALVHHYFGSKRQLFLAAVSIPVDPDELLAPLRTAPADTLGETLVHTVIELWDSDFQDAGVALLKTHIVDPDTTVLHSFLRNIIGSVLAERIEGPPEIVRTRTALVLSQMGGLLLMRYVVRLEPIATMERDELVTLIGPTIQRYLVGPLTADRG